MASKILINASEKLKEVPDFQTFSEMSIAGIYWGEGGGWEIRVIRLRSFHILCCQTIYSYKLFTRLL